MVRDAAVPLLTMRVLERLLLTMRGSALPPAQRPLGDRAGPRIDHVVVAEVADDGPCPVRVLAVRRFIGAGGRRRGRAGGGEKGGVDEGHAFAGDRPCRLASTTRWVLQEGSED